MIARTLSLVLTAVFLSGCVKKAVKPSSEDVAAAQEQAQPDPTKPFSLEDIVGQDWKDVPQLASARFDFDSASLTPEAKAALQANAKFLKEFPQIEVRVGGHCDDRGTIEYNVALGQRRARVARDYYRALGIPANRMTTISFGEERPLCTEETEGCWAKNRRAETRVRVISLESAGKKPAKTKNKGARP